MRRACEREQLQEFRCYPQGVLNAMRGVLAKDLHVRLDTPARISLFVYDNDRFIVESFQESPVDAKIVTDKRIIKFRDVVTGEDLAGQPQAGGTVFDVKLEWASYRVFAASN